MSKRLGARLRLLAALLIAFVLTRPALACHGANVKLQDDFTSASFGIWASDDDFSIASGRLRLRPTAGSLALVIDKGDLFDDVDICVDVTVPEARNTDAARGGLVFWFDNDENAPPGLGYKFYAFELTPDGRAGITRVDRGKSLSPVPLRKADGFRAGAGSANTLRVTLKGREGTAYVNDMPVFSFQGDPPLGGANIGLFGRSEPLAANIWTFANIKVTN